MGETLLRLGGGVVSDNDPSHPAKANFSADTTSTGEPGYTRVGMVKNNGVFTPTTVGTTDDIVAREIMIDQCRRIVRRNPFLQQSLINPMISLIVGTGIQFKPKDSENEELAKAIKEFIKLNAMNEEYQRFLTGLLLMEGEVIQPLGFSRTSKKVRITFLYSDTVDVFWSPDDNRIPSYLEFRPTSASMGVGKQLLPITELTDMAEFVKQIGKTGGLFQDAAVYTRTNYLTTRRGLPPLYTLLDYADNLDDYLYNRMDMVKVNAQHWLDVSVDGGKKDVSDISGQYTNIPKSGTVDIHNKKVEVTTKRFDLGSSEARDDIESFTGVWDMISMISSAVLRGDKPIEAGSILVKVTESYQTAMKSAFLLPLKAYLHFLKMHGKLKLAESETDFEVDVIFPQVSSKDISKLATSINQISLALLVARQEGWIDHENAAKSFVEAANMVLDTDLQPLKEPEEPDIAEVTGQGTGMPPKGTMPNGQMLGMPIEPQAGGAQSGQSDKQRSGRAFAKYTQNGQKINKQTQSKVSR